MRTIACLALATLLLGACDADPPNDADADADTDADTDTDVDSDADTDCETGLLVSLGFPCSQYDPVSETHPLSPPVAHVEVCLRWSQGELAPVCLDSDPSALALDLGTEILAGRPLRVTVEGSATRSGEPLAWGCSAPLVVQEGECKEIDLTVGLVDQFGTATDRPGCQGRRCPCSRMRTPRKDFTATLLHDGRVLLAGGRGAENEVLDTAEIYDPTTGTFTEVANRMKGGRAGHAAVRLNNLYGYKVLLVGGESDPGGEYQQWRVAEYFDPATGAFEVISSPLATGRVDLTATRLNDGRVLLAGGASGEGVDREYLDSLEVFDPAREEFQPVADTLSVGRAHHTATLTIVGRGNQSQVLVAGGKNGDDTLASADVVEILDRSLSATVTSRRMETARWGHAAALVGLGDKVLIAGGSSAPDDLALGCQLSLELFDGFNPKDFVSWDPLETPELGACRWGFSLIGLEAPSGSGVATRALLAVGGLGADLGSVSDVGLLIPNVSADPTGFHLGISEARCLRDSRSGHRAVRLADGSVAVFGGLYRDSIAGIVEVLDSAEIYNPGPPDWCGTRACADWGR